MTQKKHQLCLAVPKGQGCICKKKINDKFVKIRELPGASPLGPQTGLCPGPNSGLKAASRPLGDFCVHFISSLATPLVDDVFT